MAASLPDAPMVGPSTQAGGGQTSVQHPVPKDMETVSATLLSYFKAIASGSRTLSALQSAELRKSNASTVQSASANSNETFELKSLLDYFSSSLSNAMEPISEIRLDRPLAEYFISSSHNTYLTGNQFYGDASTEAYKNVLLRGCRCIEIDVWDGEEKRVESEKDELEEKHGIKSRVRNAIRHHTGLLDRDNGSENESKPADADAMPQPWNPSGTTRAEPRVLHGHTLTKEVSFRAVCEAIRESAFVKSDLPVIVSLEIHAGQEQQQTMVDIMHHVWPGLLLYPPGTEPTSLPTPNELKRKILIKVKAAPKLPATTKEAALAAAAEDDSDSNEPDHESSSKQGTATKKSKIIQSLSTMGIYTRSYHFSKLDSPDALVPTHVFSLSENKLMQVHEHFGPALFAHNRKYLMRAYPAARRVSSSNLDPTIFWRKFGVQMVALNWQRFDAGVMLNEGQFAGTGGWVLKPEAYRNIEPTTASETNANLKHLTKDLNLQVEILAAQDLPSAEEAKADRLHPYVKCQLHVGSMEERLGTGEEGAGHGREDQYKQRTRSNKGSNPDFGGELLQFPKVSTVEEVSFLRFKIQNDIMGRDSLIAWACIRLDRLRNGYRLVHLLDSKGYETKAVLFVKITTEKN